MMKNIKGFTLIELIVTITLVGAVFIAASYELTQVLKNTRITESLSYLEDIMDSTKTYVAMKKIEDRNEFNLEEIVISGLVADSIYNAPNALNGCEKFNKNTLIFYETINNEKRFYMKNDLHTCYLDKIDSCKEFLEDC